MSMLILLTGVLLMPRMMMKVQTETGRGRIQSKTYRSIMPPSVDQILQDMEFANVAFNTPSKLNIEDTFQVHLVLSLTDTIEQLKKAISEAGKKDGASYVRVSNRMEAKLAGYYFRIVSITPEVQAVSKEQLTEWKWEIYPMKEGRHNLHLTLTARIEVDGYDTPREIETFSRQIEVTVTIAQKAKSFFGNNWQWLWAAIIIPIGGWLLNRWRKKKKTTTQF